MMLHFVKIQVFYFLKLKYVQNIINPHVQPSSIPRTDVQKRVYLNTTLNL